MRVPVDKAEEVLKLGERQAGYTKVTERRHDRKATGKFAHLW